MRALIRSALSLRFLAVASLVVMIVAILTAKPARHWYLINQAKLAIRQRDHPRALDLLEDANAVRPGQRDYFFQKARVLRRLGRYTPMEQHLIEAERLGHDAELIEHQRWMAAAQSGQLSAVHAQLVGLLAQPGDEAADASAALVMAYFANARVDLALPLLDAWQADYPADAEPLFMRGYLFQGLGQWQEAARQYEQGLKLAPWRTDQRLRLGEAYIQLHRYDDAKEQLQICLEQRPQHNATQTLWARCLIESGNPEEARSVLMGILAHEPGSLEAAKLLGRLELEAGRPQQAITHLRPAAQRHPYDVPTRYALGQALSLAGEQEESLKHLKFVDEAAEPLRKLDVWLDEIVKRPGDVQLRYQIGLTLLKYMSREDGLKWLRSALELDPNHQPTREVLARYAQANGSAGEAPAVAEGRRGPVD